MDYHGDLLLGASVLLRVEYVEGVTHELGTVVRCVGSDCYTVVTRSGKIHLVNDVNRLTVVELFYPDGETFVDMQPFLPKEQKDALDKILKVMQAKLKNQRDMEQARRAANSRGEYD